MKKIATHNSATGEAGKGLLSLIVRPFARCQSKTLYEQYEAGCRWFDIRVKKVNSVWHSAHGLWTSKRTIDDMLGELDTLATITESPMYVSIMYEGKCDNRNELTTYYNKLVRSFTHLQFVALRIKKPNTTTLLTCEPTSKSCYVILDGRSWHTYLPLPWLWKKIYYNEVEFDDIMFKTVDFL